jgi:hypothetical protein
MYMDILVPKREVLHWKDPKHRIAIFLKMTGTIFIQFQEFMETTYLNRTVPVLLREKMVHPLVAQMQKAQFSPKWLNQF